MFLGGGRGGGKSFSLMLLILRHVQQYGPRARVLVTRRRLKSLLQFAEELRGLLRSAFGPGVSYNMNDNVFRLPNGAAIFMTHCESVSALQDTIQGHTYSLVIVDEAGEGPPLEVIDQLGLSLRAPGVPLRVILAGNPGGANHSALSERYVAARDPWAIFEFAGQGWAYAPSTVDSNRTCRRRTSATSRFCGPPTRRCTRRTGTATGRRSRGTFSPDRGGPMKW